MSRFPPKDDEVSTTESLSYTRELHYVVIDVFKPDKLVVGRYFDLR